jgi:aldehyde dehydrogenase (NAD+)
MESAARHITPVTLELGGKSPVIVASDADIGLAARRIIWGKCLNAGQTCVAPDYVLVDRKVHNALLEQMKIAITAMFGSDPLHCS